MIINDYIHLIGHMIILMIIFLQIGLMIDYISHSLLTFVGKKKTLSTIPFN